MNSFLLHLLRHGTPALPGRLMGRTDCPSTAEGVAACVEQAQDLECARLITSDLIRARAAADAIGATAGLRGTIDPRWRELDFGAWDGLAPAAIDPAAMAAFWDDPDANPPPDGERWSHLTDRVRAGIADLSPVPTLIVTHGGAMRAALACLCGFGQRETWALDLPYAALLSLRVWPGERPLAQIIGLR